MSYDSNRGVLAAPLFEAKSIPEFAAGLELHAAAPRGDCLSQLQRKK